MHLIKLIILSALVTLLTACLGPDIVRMDTQVREPAALHEVQIFMEKPSEDYKVIARIQIDGETSFSWSYEQQTNQIREEAAALGADAVIIAYDSETVGMLMGNNYTTNAYFGASKVTTGIAIVFDQ